MNKFNNPVAKFKQQYDEGFEAFKRGVFGIGPYPNNTMKQKEWLRGWNTAYFENLK